MAAGAAAVARVRFAAEGAVQGAAPEERGAAAVVTWACRAERVTESPEAGGGAPLESAAAAGRVEMCTQPQAAIRDDVVPQGELAAAVLQGGATGREAVRRHQDMVQSMQQLPPLWSAECSLQLHIETASLNRNSWSRKSHDGVWRAFVR